MIAVSTVLPWHWQSSPGISLLNKMEKSIADRLKEFKTASSASARDESTASSSFERHSNQSNVFTPGAYRPKKPRPGYSQDAHSSRPSAPPPFDAQRPPARLLNSSVPFPAPPTVPVFNPSAPPPGLPPFAVPPPSAAGCGASGSMPPPPPSFPPHSSAAGAHPQNNLGAIPQQGSFGAAPWQNSMGAFPPQHSRGNVPPQNSAGGVPPPQSNSGNMPRQNSFRNVPPQSNFGNVPPPSNFGNNFGNVPPQSSFGNVPPQNNFGNVPPQSNFGNVPPQSSFGNVPPQNNFGNVPTQNSFGNVPPQNNFGNVPPPNNFGNVPPPNNFGNVLPPNNFGNAVSQTAGGLSSSTQHSSFPPYTLPEGQAKFSSPPPYHHPLPEPTISDSGKVKADQCDVGAQQDVIQWLKNAGKLKDHEAASGSKDETDGTAAVAAAESDVAQKKRCSLSVCRISCPVILILIHFIFLLASDSIH